jgi:hypothetical protein
LRSLTMYRVLAAVGLLMLIMYWWSRRSLQGRRTPRVRRKK